MKNVKILLLLGVMLVNVMPYINNGKIEWKAAQAEAQFYLIENTGMGIWICGEFDKPGVIISTKPCYELTSREISNITPCYCAKCGIRKEDCNDLCRICSFTGTVDDQGHDYYTGEPSCRCVICGEYLTTCNAECINPQCPTNSSSGTGGSTSDLTNNTYPCITEPMYHYGMDIYPLLQSQGFSAGHNNWCSVMVLASIVGDSKTNICNGGSYYYPETIAQFYFDNFHRNIVSDTFGVLEKNQADFYNRYDSKITISQTIISSDGCSMYQAVKNKLNSGIIVSQSKYESGFGSGHTLLFYGFYRDLNDPLHWVNCYNTAYSGFDQILMLQDAEHTSGTFKLISK